MKPIGESVTNAVLTNEPSLTLIVPVRDEEDVILDFFQEVERELQVPYVALVIYDTDDDTTLNKKRELLVNHPNVSLVKNQYSPGVINAFRTGFKLANTAYIAPIQADLSDMPESLNRMYSKIQEGYDLVVASRYTQGGKKIGGPFLQTILSFLANHSLHFLSQIPTHDLTSMFIMYRQEVIKSIHIQSTGGFEITMELIAKAFIQGYRVSEVPTIMRDRTTGKSKFHLFQWIPKYMYWYLYILRHTAARHFEWLKSYWYKQRE